MKGEHECLIDEMSSLVNLEKFDLAYHPEAQEG